MPIIIIIIVFVPFELVDRLDHVRNVFLSTSGVGDDIEEARVRLGHNQVVDDAAGLVREDSQASLEVFKRSCSLPFLPPAPPPSEICQYYFSLLGHLQQ